jgi:hypothetical protein
MSRRNLSLIFLNIIFLSLIACGAIPKEPSATDQPRVSITETTLPASTPMSKVEPTAGSAMPTSGYFPLTLWTLQNAQYHSPDWGDYRLTNGVYYRPPLAPGESAQIYLTQLDERISYGDLNADGIEDAVVFLRTQNGGTGHFVEMAAVLNQSGDAYDIATVYLGDRVGVQSARIQEGVISMDLVVQGPNDPLCCPSQLEHWRFHLEDARLIRMP